MKKDEEGPKLTVKQLIKRIEEKANKNSLLTDNQKKTHKAEVVQPKVITTQHSDINIEENIPYNNKRNLDATQRMDDKPHKKRYIENSKRPLEIAVSSDSGSSKRVKQEHIEPTDAGFSNIDVDFIHKHTRRIKMGYQQNATSMHKQAKKYNKYVTLGLAENINQLTIDNMNQRFSGIMSSHYASVEHFLHEPIFKSGENNQKVLFIVSKCLNDLLSSKNFIPYIKDLCAMSKYLNGEEQKQVKDAIIKMVELAPEDKQKELQEVITNIKSVGGKQRP
jgi:hypothetical protein